LFIILFLHLLGVNEQNDQEKCEKLQLAGQRPRPTEALLVKLEEILDEQKVAPPVP
jgi:hypothetical protein